MHFKNKKERQLSGLSDRDKNRYDSSHLLINEREIRNRVNYVVKHENTEYLLGMSSDEFLNMLKVDENVLSIIQRCNFLNEKISSLTMESELNENVQLEIRFVDMLDECRYYYCATVKEYLKDGVFRIPHWMYGNDDICAFVLINNVIYKVYIKVNINVNYFDTEKVILFNPIISEIKLYGNSDNFKHKSIGGFVTYFDTKSFCGYTKIYSEAFIFKDLNIKYNDKVGKIKVIDIDNKNIDNYCECLNCNINVLNGVKRKEYGRYRRFYNKFSNLDN